MELADLLQKMLRSLQAEQEQLHGAAQAWARRGASLEAAVSQACAPRDLERFSGFMADLERVLGLLLLLGSRLARVRRALARAGADSDPDEQVTGVEAGESGAGRGLPARSGTTAAPCPAHGALSLAAGLSAAAARAPAAAAGRRQGAEGARGAARAGPARGAGAGPARRGAERLSRPAGRQGRRPGPAAQPGRAGPAPSGPTRRRQGRPWPSPPASQFGLAPRDPSSR